MTLTAFRIDQRQAVAQLSSLYVTAVPDAGTLRANTPLRF
jgi:hypothetical protein